MNETLADAPPPAPEDVLALPLLMLLLMALPLSQAPKKVAPLPAAAKKGQAAAPKVVNPLYEKRPKSFGEHGRSSKDYTQSAAIPTTCKENTDAKTVL